MDKGKRKIKLSQLITSVFLHTGVCFFRHFRLGKAGDLPHFPNTRGNLQKLSRHRLCLCIHIPIPTFPSVRRYTEAFLFEDSDEHLIKRNTRLNFFETGV